MVSSTAVPDEFRSKWNTTDRSSRESRPRAALTGKLRSACDLCRQARVKCNGGHPCRRCEGNSHRCHYSPSLRKGRLKVTRQSEGSGLSPSTSGENSQRDSPFAVNTPDNSVDSQEKGSENASNTPQLPGFSNSGMPTFPAMDFSHLQLPSLPSEFSFSQIAGSPLPDLSTGTSLEPNIWPTTNPPPLMFPLALDQPLLPGPESSSRCSCLNTQLHCVAELYGHVDYDTIELDTVLGTVRKISQSISEYLACLLCSRTSFAFILVTIAMQRMILLVCHVSKNGATYVQRTRMSVGTFQLDEEDDRTHKRMLILSTARKVSRLVDEMDAAVKEYYGKQTNCKFGSQTGQSNLRWVLQVLEGIRRRTATIARLAQREDWGLRDFTVQCPQDG
ncbi:hypothetical protein ASPZODRAFT_110343 [Penicilliopsis zonata CBS 506.65]|uniref:Xylanolytic transcriptional activator xlnR n=1 Tax=Penicilliopsis zonata CBS 506.65 TaxID=1073090 RepID=A0A1L9SSV5_9EURO|nr:hypothetical protein ASPZODRAFT_110343 [Penicilliopsis zonata CBS 506.65]OJJ50181.1 hypothetical protein ASPZODRAFT_110343 [Penicilliopsis zonata CBS 506.65]